MIFLSDFPLTNLTLGTYQLYQKLPISIIAISCFLTYYIAKLMFFFRFMILLMFAMNHLSLNYLL